MKIEFNRKHMLAAYSAIIGVVPAKSARPILQNMKLTVDHDGNATLLASDIEIDIAYRLLGVKTDEWGSVLLTPKRVGDILRTSSDETLSLQTEGDKLRIKGGKSEYNLTSEDPDGFPATPEFAAEAYYVVAASDLKRAIRRTQFCTDQESSRYALGGVLFELTPTSLRCVGTDGRRLAQQDSAAEVEGEPTTPPNPVIPQKCLKLLDKVLDDGDPPVHIAVTANNIVFRTESCVVHSRLAEGRFPRYQDVFPSQSEVTIPLNVGEFHSVVEQSAIVTSEESRGVDFEFTAGNLRLKAQAADVGSSAVEMPVAHEGKDIVISFDPRYVVDMLKVLDPASSLDLGLIDSKNAAIFRSGDGLSYVCMPLTRSA